MTLFKPDLDAPYGYVHQTVQQRRLELEGFSHSSRENAGEYCESSRELKYTRCELHRIIEQDQIKTKFDEVFTGEPPGGEVRKDENLRKQTCTLPLGQAFNEVIQLRAFMFWRASGLSSQSPRRQW